MPPGQKIAYVPRSHEMQALDMSTDWNKALNTVLNPLPATPPTNALVMILGF